MVAELLQIKYFHYGGCQILYSLSKNNCYSGSGTFVSCCVIMRVLLMQSLLVSGGGRWNDSKDGTESSSTSSSQTAGSWNVDVFVDIVKELVRFVCYTKLCLLIYY